MYLGNTFERKILEMPKTETEFRNKDFEIGRFRFNFTPQTEGVITIERILEHITLFCYNSRKI